MQHIKKVGELYLLKIPEGSWQEISINIIRLLSKSNEKDAIVVIMNWFIKMIRLKATTINISLEEIAKIYQDNIWKLHEVLRKILSDQRSQFVSKFIEELTKVLGIKRMLLTVYYPQTDRQMEWIN